MNNDHAIGFGIGLLTGAVIGGTIALLFAPRSGKETRELIKARASDMVEEVKDKTAEVVGAVKDKTTGVVRALKE